MCAHTLIALRQRPGAAAAPGPAPHVAGVGRRERSAILTEAAFRETEARERLAEAEARTTQMVSDAIAIAIANGSVQAINYFVAQKYLEASTALATAPNQKFVLMPMESSGIIGSIAGIAELAREAAGKPDAPVRVPPMPPRAGA